MGANVLLFGSGYMGREYLRVLKELNCSVTIVGRDEEKAKKLAVEFGQPSQSGYGGGVAALDTIDCAHVDLAIVAVSAEVLKGVTLACLQKGIKKILVEKPGALDLGELEEIKANVPDDVRFRIAHNRRIYNSVQSLKKLIKEDGGAIGCFFDFTELEQYLLQTKKDKRVTARWGFANSAHVIDTAFFLIGKPIELHADRSGSWECHPSGTVFVGHGKTATCLFSYFASWEGAGRWNIEIATRRGRYKLSPLEELQFCAKNQFAWQTLDLPDDDDTRFKPGLLKMTKSMLNDESGIDDLPTIDDQIAMCKIVDTILGYEGCV